MASSPLVSIIMPAYNAERFLVEAVMSVQAQTWPHWELIIVDDASTDGTALCAQAMLGDPRIRYHRVSRIGSPAGVRNAGLALAEGDYIAFLDADDRYLPTALETLLAPLRDNAYATAAYGFARNMDEAGNPLPERDMLIEPADGPSRLPDGYAHTWERIVMGQISCLLPALMLRRDTLARVGTFNETLCGPEDFEFYVRLFIDRKDGVVCIPAAIYNYRVYGASLTKDPKRHQRVMDSALAIIDWLFTDGTLPEPLMHLLPMAYRGCYRHFIREKLVDGQPGLAREIAWQGLQRGHIAPDTWIRAFMPLLVRSYLPTALDQHLVRLKSAARRQVQPARVAAV